MYVKKKIFKIICTLKNHRITSSGEKPFQFDVSEEICMTNSNLNQCDVYERIFKIKTSSNLKNHMPTHSGEKMLCAL